MESPNPRSLTTWLRGRGVPDRDLDRVFATFNVAAFAEASHEAHSAKDDHDASP
jgi:hypothetical protein